jgi:hypothetical protein
MAKVLEVIWGVRKPKYFFKGDWTGRIALIQFNKFGRTRKRLRLLAAIQVVIPGRAPREPGIHNHDREYGFRACAKWRIPE